MSTFGAWPLSPIRRAGVGRAATSSGLLVVVLVVVALLAPVLSPVSPSQISTDNLQSPFGHYILGTDELGRSVAIQLIFGLRVSLLVGLLSALVATVLGIAVGAVAGYFGRWLDVVLMRVTEVFQVMPSFILAALIVALLGAGLSRVIAVIAILSWPEAARVMRSEVIRIRELEYVDAARSLGIGEWRVMLGEVIPNALGPVAAVGTLIIGRAILLEASLSFFGLSSADVPSWGRMLNSGQRFLFQAWWLSVFPGVAIFVTVLLFNIFGDAVTRALDPRRST
jgi:peptide/nickel transport system permease protein